MNPCKDSIKLVEKLKISNYFMFGQVMKNEQILKSFVSTLLDINIDNIKKLEIEKTCKEGYLNKGVRFDVYFKDSDKIFDIEMQVDNKGDLPKRARENDTYLSYTNLCAGEKYNDAKESYVVFICLFDLFNNNDYKYHFVNYDLEHKRKLNDGRNIIFFNALAYDKAKNTEISNLLKYISGEKYVTTNLVKKLENEVNTIKRNEFLVSEFMKYERILNDSKTDGIELGRIEGKDERNFEIAINMLSKYDNEEISNITGLSLEEIQKLRFKHQNNS